MEGDTGPIFKLIVKDEALAHRVMLFQESGPLEYIANVQGSTGHSWEPSLGYMV